MSPLRSMADWWLLAFYSVAMRCCRTADGALWWADRGVRVAERSLCLDPEGYEAWVSVQRMHAATMAGGEP